MEQTPIKHTPEPWTLTSSGLAIMSDNRHVTNIYGACSLNEDERNAARIVDCVNALQGINDPKSWIIEAKHRFNTSEGLGYQNQQLQSEIENYKTMESLHKDSSHTIRMQAKEILDLKEKAKYSEEVIRVLKEDKEEMNITILTLHQEIEQLKAERSVAKTGNRAEELLNLIEEESIIERNVNLFNDLRKDKPKAFDTDTIHKTELKAAKSEAWEKGFTAGCRHSASVEKGRIVIIDNPYKQ